MSDAEKKLFQAEHAAFKAFAATRSALFPPEPIDVWVAARRPFHDQIATLQRELTEANERLKSEQRKFVDSCAAAKIIHDQLLSVAAERDALKRELTEAKAKNSELDRLAGEYYTLYRTALDQREALKSCQVVLCKALNACREWMLGDKWRRSTDASEVKAWHQQMDVIEKAIGLCQPAPKGGSTT